MQQIHAQSHSSLQPLLHRWALLLVIGPSCFLRLASVGATPKKLLA